MLVIALHVAHYLASGAETGWNLREGAGRRVGVRGELGAIALGLGRRHVLLRNQAVDRLLAVHFNNYCLPLVPSKPASQHGTSPLLHSFPFL